MSRFAAAGGATCGAVGDLLAQGYAHHRCNATVNHFADGPAESSLSNKQPPPSSSHTPPPTWISRLQAMPVRVIVSSIEPNRMWVSMATTMAVFVWIDPKVQWKRAGLWCVWVPIIATFSHQVLRVSA